MAITKVYEKMTDDNIIVAMNTSLHNRLKATDRTIEGPDYYQTLIGVMFPNEWPAITKSAKDFIHKFSLEKADNAEERKNLDKFSSIRTVVDKDGIVEDDMAIIFTDTEQVSAYELNPSIFVSLEIPRHNLDWMYDANYTVDCISAVDSCYCKYKDEQEFDIFRSAIQLILDTDVEMDSTSKGILNEQMKREFSIKFRKLMLLYRYDETLFNPPHASMRQRHMDLVLMKQTSGRLLQDFSVTIVPYFEDPVKFDYERTTNDEIWIPLHEKEHMKKSFMIYLTDDLHGSHWEVEAVFDYARHIYTLTYDSDDHGKQTIEINPK